MLDTKKLFQNDQEYYYDWYEQICLIKYLLNIGDYIAALKKVAGENSSVDKWLNDKISKCNQDVYKYCLRFYEQTPPKHQFYVIIKDNIGRITPQYLLIHDYNTVFDIYCEDIDKAIEYYESQGYIILTLAQYYKNELFKTLVYNQELATTFVCVEDAARWCLDQGLSRGTLNRAKTQIKKALKENSKAYGYKWNYKKEGFNTNVELQTCQASWAS